MTQTGTKSACLTLLLIEDERGVREFVRSALERSGYQVVTADSGADALQLLANGQFQGVVSDMRTPGGVDGAQVHAWIATHRPELVSRMVFITGDIASEETAALLKKTGAPCVQKPFLVREFIAVVQKTMGKAVA
jgi:two-component system NtrC family sensor kinase